MRDFLRKVFNKENKKIYVTAEPHPLDTPTISHHRNEINNKMEDLLNRIVSVKNDRRLSTEEKYAIVISSLMSVKKLSDEILTSDTLFTEKEYRKLKKEIRKEMDNKPAYVG